MADISPQLASILVENVERSDVRAEHVELEAEALLHERKLGRNESALVAYVLTRCLQKNKET